MLNKIKSLILSLSVLGMFAVPVLVPATASAATYAPNGNLCNGSNFNLNPTSSNTTTDCQDNNTNALGPKIAHYINIFSAVIGVLAVIIIIYAGFRYVSSAGNKEGVEAAKNAIIYAIIGLVVVALAQAIVHFVINALG